MPKRMGWGVSAGEGKEWEMWESGMGNLAVRIGTSCVDGIGARRGSRQAHQSIPMERSYAMGKGKEDCDTRMIVLMSKRADQRKPYRPLGRVGGRVRGRERQWGKMTSG